MGELQNLGDAQLISELAKMPTPAASAGREFIRRIREAQPGSFKRMKSGQFNYGPLDFLAVVVQPKAESIRVTVYGQPHAFGRTATLTLKPELKSYTSFKLRSQSEVDDAVRVALKAAELKEEFRARPRRR